MGEAPDLQLLPDGGRAARAARARLAVARADMAAAVRAGQVVLQSEGGTNDQLECED